MSDNITLKYQKERLELLKGSLKYTREQLDGELEDWERREYEMVAAEHQRDIASLEDCIKAQETPEAQAA